MAGIPTVWAALQAPGSVSLAAASLSGKILDMGWSVTFLLVRLLDLLRLGPSPDHKDGEIAVLRHQLTVLRRQMLAAALLPCRLRHSRGSCPVGFLRLIGVTSAFPAGACISRGD